MATKLATVLEKIDRAATQVFNADPKVRSVGVGKTTDGYGFIAVRNDSVILPFSKASTAVPPSQIDGIPVEYTASYADPVRLVLLPNSGPGSPGTSSVVPEQLFQRPLVCGLQVQNFDDDSRTGVLANGYMTVGTLGCFVVQNGKVAILSNNHVLAGENRGNKNSDRILQPGSSNFLKNQHVATLTEFVPLTPSAKNASYGAGTAKMNDVDAAIAAVEADHLSQVRQSYLPIRLAPAAGGVPPPSGVAAPAIGDVVYKVGRTTGLTWGTIKQIGAIVGPVPYDPGPCWFRQNIVIEGKDGTLFSDHGDSGSVIVRQDGVVVGLLYAGNGTQTYACDINLVLNALNCSLA